ncbi:MAG TPA: hypothetical protein VGE77_09460 [Nocardioides sp.]
MLVAAAAAVLVVGVGVPWAASELTSRPGVSDAPTTTPTLGIEPAPFEAGPDGDLARLYGAGFAAGIDPLNLGIRLDPATGTVLASTLPERLATLDAAVRPLAEELGYAYTSTPWDAPQTMDEVPAIQVPMGEVGLVLEGLYAGERTYGIYLNFAAEALTVWRGAPDAKRDAAAHAAGEAVGIDVQVLGATWTFDDRDALLAQLQGRQDEWRALGFTVEHTRALPTGAIVGVLGDVAAAEAALVGAPGIVGVEEHVEVAAPQPLTS